MDVFFLKFNYPKISNAGIDLMNSIKRAFHINSIKRAVHINSIKHTI